MSIGNDQIFCYIITMLVTYGDNFLGNQNFFMDNRNYEIQFRNGEVKANATRTLHRLGRGGKSR